MSHDSHAAHHTEPKNSRPGSSFTSSIWFMLLLALLFIASVNFVKVMSHDDGGHGTEHAAPAHGDGHDAGHGATEHHEETGHGH